MRSSLIAPVVLLSLAPPVPPAAKAPVPSKERLDALVRQLGDDAYARREEATRALTAIGDPAVAALRRAGASRDPEVRRRAGRLVELLQRRALLRERARLAGTWVDVSEEEDGEARVVKGDTTITVRFLTDTNQCVLIRRAGAAVVEKIVCT